MSTQESYKHLSPEEFSKLDFNSVTLVDLREPDEVLVSGIDSALNIPFSGGFDKLDSIPKDKPVVVFCRVGDWSEQIAEILYDRGYDVSTLDGGYNAYRKYLKENRKVDSAKTAEDKAKPAEKAEQKTDEKTDGKQNADVVNIDAKGLKCPGPIVKVGDTLRAYPDGTKFHVQATEDAFCSDIKVWCERTGNTLDSLKVNNGIIDAEITKAQAQKNEPSDTKSVQVIDSPHGKNFVVFDDDLDKVIAAFIMANGAAAMGRPVTMFFTFWGLNVLRKPKKVKVKKNFIEKMFGIMMPRGTKKLPLSHMNMGGAGPKMIRAIMKQHNITSVEDLIQSAIDHGVRIIVCQMSMKIMGIKKEELIDGLEYGGVSTFLGNAELSDMSLFI